jgi:hypothetical protein
MDTDMNEQKWTVRELTMQNIRDVAEYRKLSLEGVDLLDVVYSVEKGVDAALDNWGQIIEEAIRNAGRNKDSRGVMPCHSMI